MSPIAANKTDGTTAAGDHAAHHNALAALVNTHDTGVRPASTDEVQARVLKQLRTFTDWLRLKPGSRGLIGEVGWPGREEDFGGLLSDSNAWKAVAEQWYRAADFAELDVANWGPGCKFGSAYRLSPYSNPSLTTAASIRHSGIADVIEAHPTFGRVLRGVNVSCLEWEQGGPNDFAVDGTTNPGGFSNLAPGVLGTDYAIEPTGSWAYLFSQGVRLVRIPFSWERMQPTLNAALDATYLGNLQTMVTAARNAGLRVCIEAHNYGGYWQDVAGTATRKIISLPNAYVPGTLTAANFADLWTRLSTVFSSDAGVFYGLMNEPANTAPGPGEFGIVVNVGDFEDGTVQGWVDFGGTAVLANSAAFAQTGTKSLKATFNGSATFGTLAKTVAISTDPTSTKFAAWIRPTVSCNATMSLKFVSDGFTLAGNAYALVANVWNLVECEIPRSRAGQALNLLTVAFTGLPLVATDVYLDQIAFGVGVTGGTRGAAWERITQIVVNAIRLNNDRKRIYVPLFDIANVDRSLANHPHGPWIDDPGGVTAQVFYEAHHYFDVNMSGFYANPFAQQITFAQSNGFTPSY